jgi:hypothetical protein
MLRAGEIFVRQLAETLKYAHQKKLYHRALCPQSILAEDPGAASPLLQVMNWQTAAREATTGGTSMRTVSTVHVDEYVEDLGRGRASCRRRPFALAGAHCRLVRASVAAPFRYVPPQKYLCRLLGVF